MSEEPIELVAIAAGIVAAYASRNSLPAAELTALIGTIHDALQDLASGKATVAAVAPAQVPAVPIRKSVTGAHIICLEDGRPFRTLKGHLMKAYGLTPEAYRAKWGLPADYPMVAPGYAAERSRLAKESGLGRKKVVPSPAPEPTAAPPPKPKRGRPPKVVTV